MKWIQRLEPAKPRTDGMHSEALAAYEQIVAATRDTKSVDHLLPNDPPPRVEEIDELRKQVVNEEPLERFLPILSAAVTAADRSPTIENLLVVAEYLGQYAALLRDTERIDYRSGVPVTCVTAAGRFAATRPRSASLLRLTFRAISFDEILTSGPEISEEIAAETLDLAQALDLPALTTRAQIVLGAHFSFRRSPRRAIALYESVLESGSPPGFLNQLSIYMNLALDRLSIGETEAAETAIENLAAVIQRENQDRQPPATQRWALAFASAHSAWARGDQRDYFFRGALSHSKKGRDRFAYLISLLGFLLFLRDIGQEARALTLLGDYAPPAEGLSLDVRRLVERFKVRVEHRESIETLDFYRLDHELRSLEPRSSFIYQPEWPDLEELERIAAATNDSAGETEIEGGRVDL